jgi:hypothetical protein
MLPSKNNYEYCKENPFGDGHYRRFGPALTTCSISPATIASGSSSVAVTVSVSTTAAVAAVSMPSRGHDHSTLATWMFQVPGFLMVGLLAVGGKRRKIALQFLLLTVIGLALLATACGGSSTTPKPPAQGGTAPGTYTMLVTAGSGSVNHTMPLTLTVQ